MSVEDKMSKFNFNKYFYIIIILANCIVAIEI